MAYNDTYEERHHKFCINIPLELYPKIRRRSKELEFSNLKEYILYLAQVDLKYEILHRPERYAPKQGANIIV